MKPFDFALKMYHLVQNDRDDWRNTEWRDDHILYLQTQIGDSQIRICKTDRLPIRYRLIMSSGQISVTGLPYQRGVPARKSWRWRIAPTDLTLVEGRLLGLL